jgi:hypothetical protein
MKLIIHRGSIEIGGSCVEVTAGNTRIILDVGLPLDYPGDKLVDPKGSKRARNHFPSGAAHVPRVPGLFQAGPSVDVRAPLMPSRRPSRTAVAIVKKRFVIEFPATREYG